MWSLVGEFQFELFVMRILVVGTRNPGCIHMNFSVYNCTMHTYYSNGRCCKIPFVCSGLSTVDVCFTQWSENVFFRSRQLAHGTQSSCMQGIFLKSPGPRLFLLLSRAHGATESHNVVMFQHCLLFTISKKQCKILKIISHSLHGMCTNSGTSHTHNLSM